MRVICIKSEIYIFGDKKGAPSINKGSIYHVIKKLPAEKVALNNSELTSYGARPASGDWYELLELFGLHHHSNFLELPDDLFDTVESEKKLEEVEQI